MYGWIRECIVKHRENIDSYLAKDRTELEQARRSGDQAKAGHLEAEIKDLEKYKAHHPGEEYRVYDD